MRNWNTINFKQWIDENRSLLKPPVGNKVIYHDTDFIVMVVGGPNSRKDFHFNEGEEFFYQIEGDINVRIMDGKTPVNIPIKQGDIFLLPPRTPHSPQRGPNTIGLVIERTRRSGELDGFQWYCEECGEKMHEEYMPLQDIVKELPVVFEKFYSNKELRTCKHCHAVMEPPAKLK